MSSRLFRHMAVAACAALLSMAVHAQGAGMPEACKADTHQFCAGAKPGGGRVVSCLQQHEAELSPSCKEKLPALAQCSAEVRKVCGDAGPRKLRECVKEKSASFSDACKGVAR